MHDDDQPGFYTGCIAVSADAARENGLVAVIYFLPQITGTDTDFLWPAFALCGNFLSLLPFA
jgi:hypothetical protein